MNRILVDEEVAKIEAVKPDDNSSSKKNIEKPKDEKPAENENKTQVNEMEEKLRKMQEEMAKMQKELEAAKVPFIYNVSTFLEFDPSLPTQAYFIF